MDLRELVLKKDFYLQSAQMVCKSEWWSVLSGRHESHHMIPVGVVSCDPVRVGVSQRRTFFFPIDNFKQISHGVVHKNGETPAVIGQLAIVRADQLPTNGVSHLRPMQQHSREFNVCMLCNTTSAEGKDTKASQKSALVLQVPL